MTKRERSLVGVLVVLSAISGLIYYFNTRETSSAASTVSVDGNYTPIAVENPHIITERLEGLQHVEYTGSHRNIFSETPLPHVPTPEEVKTTRLQECASADCAAATAAHSARSGKRKILRLRGRSAHRRSPRLLHKWRRYFHRRNR